MLNESWIRCCISRKLLVKELRSLPHRVSLGLSGGGGRIGGFFPLSHLELGKSGLFWARFRSYWVSGSLDVQKKNRPSVMLLMLAWACRLMLLMLVVCC